MEPPHLDVPLALVQLGETETGIWCGRCLLPSIERVTFVMEVDGAPVSVFAYQACTDCGYANAR